MALLPTGFFIFLQVKADQGWIKLHRKSLESVVFQDAKLWHLWSYCLLKANHKPNEFLWNGAIIVVQKGQFITGRKEMSKDLNQNEGSVYRRLKILEKLGKVNIKTNNKFSLLTIRKYSTYQDLAMTSEQQIEQQMNNKRTTNEQQMNTNNNDKNDKNDKKIEGEEIFQSSILSQPLFKIEECRAAAEYCGMRAEEGEKFFHYYNAQGWKRGKSGLLISDLISAFRSWIGKANELGLNVSSGGETFDEKAARLAKENAI